MSLLINSYRFASAPSFNPKDIAGCVGCWVADDASAVGDGNAVTNWVDRKSSITVTQATSGFRPLYRASGVGGQPAIDFDGTDDLLVYTAASPVSVATSGHVFAVVNTEGSVSPSRMFWSTADIVGSVRFVYGGYSFATNGRVGIGQRNNDSQDIVEGTTTITTTATDYLLEWGSSGTAYDLRVNNNVQSKTAVGGSDLGDWFGDTTARDVFTIGAMKYTDERWHSPAKIAALIVVDGTISGGDRTSLLSWVATKYGLTLAP